MSGPVVFGYDGSELVQAAIANAGRQLPAHRDALVVTTGGSAALGCSTLGYTELTGRTRQRRLRLIPAPA